MAGIRIRVETRALEEALASLSSGAAARAIARAINRTATSVRRNILRELSEQIGLAQRRLAGRVRLSRVNVGAAGRVASGRQGVLGGRVTARATITAAGSDITAMAFQPRQTRQGVSFSPGRGARRRRIASAFLAEVPGGARGVFIRATEAPNVLAGDVEGVRRRRRVARTGTDIPIARVVLPGVSRALFDAAVQDRIQRDGAETLAKRLQEQVSAELRGQIRRVRRRRR